MHVAHLMRDGFKHAGDVALFSVQYVVFVNTRLLGYSPSVVHSSSLCYLWELGFKLSGIVSSATKR